MIEHRYGDSSEDTFVWTITEKYIKDRLKSPSTAKCGTYVLDPNPDRISVVKIEHNTWQVSGWVEAENSYGATPRTDFTVRVHYLDELEQYTFSGLKEK